MNNYSLKLKIADVVIKMQSEFPVEQLSEEKRRVQVSERFDNFSYRGEKKEDILINIVVEEKLPQIRDTKPLFITYHFQDGDENWRLLVKGDNYIYKCPLEDKKQLMVINKGFNKITAYLLLKENKSFVWSSGDIIYDFLQVLLINYFAQRKEGIFTHAIGIKDLDGQGLLFSGRSGAGKSTTARIWHRHSKAMILNDDRIIVLKNKAGFCIHGSPWHGEFSDYLASRIEPAPLEKIFFIHHSPKNRVREISKKEAFRLLYPTLFPTFWDKEYLGNIVSFCEDLINNLPCYKLGFLNDRKIIDFIRKV